jgi:hypothetical protein
MAVPKGKQQAFLSSNVAAGACEIFAARVEIPITAMLF